MDALELQGQPGQGGPWLIRPRWKSEPGPPGPPLHWRCASGRRLASPCTGAGQAIRAALCIVAGKTPNIPADRLDAEDIARVYRARWEVELIFKELKSHYQLDRLPSTKAHIVEALIYTAILTLIVSRKILVALRRLQGVAADRTPERRWTITFHSCAARLLDLLLDPSAAPARWRGLEEFLTREFLDPNRSRPRNLSVAWS